MKTCQKYSNKLTEKDRLKNRIRKKIMINKEEQSFDKGKEAEVETKKKEERIVEAEAKINKHNTKKEKSLHLHLHRNLILVLTHPVHDFC